MKTLILFSVFAAAFAYVSPLTSGKWQSRAMRVVMVSMVAGAGVPAMTTISE